MERAVSLCRNFLSPEDSRESDNAIQVIRELLVNAIEHGNQGNETLSVVIAIERIADGKFQIDVHDEGAGFSIPPRQWANMPGTGAPRNRGLAIVHSLCDEVGTAPDHATVSVQITLDKPVSIHVDKKATGWTITPGGDLSATNAEAFRNALSEWISADNPACVLNLAQVRTMDSICLSALLAFARELHERNLTNRIRLEKMQPGLHTLFQLTQIHRLFHHA